MRRYVIRSLKSAHRRSASLLKQHVPEHERKQFDHTLAWVKDDAALERVAALISGRLLCVPPNRGMMRIRTRTRRQS